MRLLTFLFLFSLIWLVPMMAHSKPAINITETDVVIDVRNGLPLLKAKIRGQTYQFIVSPATDNLFLSPSLVEDLNLEEGARIGPPYIVLDHALYKPKKTSLPITFSILPEEDYTVFWLSTDPYEGYSGVVPLSIFGDRDVTFQFSDAPFEDGLTVSTFKTFKKKTTLGGWRLQLDRYFGKDPLHIAFRPHYDKTRMTIGAAYGFEDQGNLEFTGESYFMPREFLGYREFTLANFKTPITPLKGLKPLTEAEVHVIFGSFDAAEVTEGDVVKAKGVSPRRYSRVLWLGLDYFEDCQKVVISKDSKKLTTYCPN